MPGGDRTGPPAGSPRRIGRRGAFPPQSCVCPKCGQKVMHARGVPCNTVMCPKCKTAMNPQ